MSLSLKPSSQLQAEITELKAIENSRGWAIMKEELDADILKAAISLSSPAHVSTEDLHFRRGALYASVGMKSLIQAAIQIRETELVLRSADQQTREQVGEQK